MAYSSPSSNKIYGVVARFENVEKLLHAGEKVSQSGYTHIDAFSPFPIHGIEKYMKIPRSRLLPWIVFFVGLSAGISAIFMQWWMNTHDYPFLIGGKPIFSYPSFLPVTFECTVLASGLTTFLSLLLFMGLPKPHHPLLSHPGFERVSDDAFFIVIESKDPCFDEIKIHALFKNLGGMDIATVHEE